MLNQILYLFSLVWLNAAGKTVTMMIKKKSMLLKKEEKVFNATCRYFTTYLFRESHTGKIVTME